MPAKTKRKGWKKANREKPTSREEKIRGQHEWALNFTAMTGIPSDRYIDSLYRSSIIDNIRKKYAP